MKVFLLFILFLLAGCSATAYERRGADGSVCRVTIFRSAIDSNLAGVDLKLADGTTLQLQAAQEQPDKSVVSAVTAVAQSVVGLGAVFLKLLGVP